MCVSESAAVTASRLTCKLVNSAQVDLWTKFVGFDLIMIGPLRKLRVRPEQFLINISPVPWGAAAQCDRCGW